MNAVLWAVQAIVAIKLFTITFNHAIRVDPTMLRPGTRRLGSAERPVLVLAGVLALLAGLALILPGVTGIQPSATPWAAVAAAIMMIVALGLHPGCRDHPKPFVEIVLAVMAVFVAYGRSVIVPL